MAQAGVEVTEYVTAGVAQDALYVLYLAAADAVVPTPNAKARHAASLQRPLRRCADRLRCLPCNIVVVARRFRERWRC